MFSFTRSALLAAVLSLGAVWGLSPRTEARMD